MTLIELKRMAEFGEGPFIEFKLRVPRPEKIVREVVAFANTDGGKILIGVDDDGTLIGVKDVKEEEFALESALEALCTPPVPFSILTVPISRKREVLVVDVPASKKKPHFCMPKGEKRTAFVRVKDQALEASREMVRLMRMSKHKKGVRFQYGPREHALIRYLDRYERITVHQFAKLVGIPPRLASQTLVLLTRANILRIHPSETEDQYTLAYDLQTEGEKK